MAFNIELVLVLVNHVVGLVVTLVVMKVEVASSSPVKSVPLILPGKLQAQLLVHIPSLDIVHNILNTST